MNQLSKLSFGQIAAEEDRQLHKYYVKIGLLDAVMKEGTYLIIGRKGSGKTAMYKQIKKNSTNVENIEFNDHAWSAIRGFSDETKIENSRFTAYFKFFFLVNLITSITKSKIHGERAKQILKTVNPDAVFAKNSQGMSNILQKLRSAGVSLAGTGFSVSFADGIEPNVANCMNFANEYLLQSLKEMYRVSPVHLQVDRLDDVWDSSDVAKEQIIGALKAARSINTAIEAVGLQPVTIYLRSDIYDELQFNDKNKFKGRDGTLKWNDTLLRNVIESRISATIGCSEEGAFARVFTPVAMKSKSSKWGYIRKHTMDRPRDVVQYCIYCLEEAKKSGATMIDNQHIYDAKSQYSAYLRQEVLDEALSQFPAILEIFDAITTYGFSNFSSSEYATLRGLSNPVQTREELHRLYQFAVIGYYKTGGKAGGKKAQFVYNSPGKPGQQVANWHVHPGLHNALKLKEQRKRKADH